ncbi:hypothetical protein [Corallococcus silvisoli]|uniref:hypothetical protein n=1 Tax=Corallococcus silvisoli TaxID=2697031 RepID=UPI00137710E3|nr:hypothetical protein [Corallococcus silvisoli]NBD12294.1 hypothetical protein [Corallococcus silvisoli]
MTRIPEDAQQAWDLDWFAVDGEGRLAHFTSLGRPLPESIAVSWEDLRQVQRYFRTAPALGGEPRVDPGLEAREVFATQDMRERYLRDFRAMGERGLYAYDLEPRGRGWVYRRVILPEVPLLLEELPGPVRAIVGRTVLTLASFARDAAFDGPSLNP